MRLRAHRCVHRGNVHLDGRAGKYVYSYASKVVRLSVHTAMCASVCVPVDWKTRGIAGLWSVLEVAHGSCTHVGLLNYVRKHPLLHECYRNWVPCRWQWIPTLRCWRRWRSTSSFASRCDVPLPPYAPFLPYTCPSTSTTPYPHRPQQLTCSSRPTGPYSLHAYFLL